MSLSLSYGELEDRPRAVYRRARDYCWQPSLQWVTGLSIIQTMAATSFG